METADLLSPIQEFTEPSGKCVYLEQQGHTKFRVNFTLKCFVNTTKYMEVQ